jgi:hypothetical protein
MRRPFQVLFDGSIGFLKMGVCLYGGKICSHHSFVGLFKLHLEYLHINDHSLYINFLTRPGSLQPPSPGNCNKFQAVGPVLRARPKFPPDVVVLKGVLYEKRAPGK